MGYCMEQTDSNFIIKKENFRDALNNLKAVFTPDKMTCIDYVWGKEFPHFRWVQTDIVLDAETLEDALEEIRYNPIFNDNGDIINVEFTGEKYGDEKIFFAALAPFVEKDSYISFEGEDDCKWTWCFNGKEVRQSETLIGDKTMDEMVQEISWEEFRNSGLLWLTNSILHTFGMAIAIDFDEGKAVRAYPTRVKYRGFDEKTNDKGYYNVSKYMKDNASDLLSECDVPEDIDPE